MRYRGLAQITDLSIWAVQPCTESYVTRKIMDSDTYEDLTPYISTLLISFSEMKEIVRIRLALQNSGEVEETSSTPP